MHDSRKLESFDDKECSGLFSLVWLSTLLHKASRVQLVNTGLTFLEELSLQYGNYVAS